MFDVDVVVDVDVHAHSTCHVNILSLAWLLARLPDHAHALAVEHAMYGSRQIVKQWPMACA